MKSIFDYEYEVEVEHEGIHYNVYADLYDHGHALTQDNWYEVVYDPEFHNFLVLDPETDTTHVLSDTLKEKAIESLNNLYWYKTLD